jgi:hypothetical protein
MIEFINFIFIVVCSCSALPCELSGTNNSRAFGMEVVGEAGAGVGE